MTIDKDNFPDRWLIVLLSLLLCARLVLAAQIDFLEDEAYYRLWGLYPSYAYFDHAPMVGWWIAAGQSLFGDTKFALRFLSPVSSFLGSFVIWRIAQISFDRRSANSAVLLFNAMPMIGIGSIIMTPDVPSVFFWGLAIWTLIEWNKSNRNFWWIAFGVAAGLGLLSKYTNIFLGVGVLIWLATSGRWRQAIRAPEFYIAGVIAAALFSPVVYWNAIHDWASFSKQFGRLQSHAYTIDYLGEWIGGQVLLISPILFGFLAVALVKLFKLRTIRNINVQLIIVSVIPMVTYFFVHAFSSRINANWTVPLYSNFAILTAYSVTHAASSRSSITSKLAAFAAPLGFAMTIFVLVEAIHPVLPADTRNPISQLRGYDDLTVQIHNFAKSENAKSVLTTNYQLTGLLSFHLRDLVVIQPTERIRYLNVPNPSARIFESPALFVAREGAAESIIQSLTSCYKSAAHLENIRREDRGVILEIYEVWRIDEFNPAIFNRGRIEDCNGQS